MKYFELVIAIVFWVIAVLWFKNSPPGEFPYEPLLTILAGIVALFDSLRRFGLFTRVHISIRNSNITPWSFAGGKINKTNVSTEIFIENDTDTEVLIRTIEFIAPIRIKNSIGESNRKIRLVDLANLGIDVSLPITVPANSTKTIFAESAHDATSLEKYNQASNLGKLEASEHFGVIIKYSKGPKEKSVSTSFSTETTELVSKARKNYEETGDHKGVITIIEKT